MQKAARKWRKNKMGIYACYKEVDDRKIQEMLCENKEPEQEEIVFEKSNTCSLDKLWDGLHCLLTGGSKYLNGNPFSEAVLGKEIAPQNGEISFVFPERTVEIAAALNEFDLKAALDAFSPEHFDKEKIYPSSIWLRDDKESLKQELETAFKVLKDFYNETVKNQKGVMVIIG